MMSDDLTRMKHGTELHEKMNEAQRKEVDDAQERIRMGESCFFHEIAKLVLERDAVKKQPTKGPEALMIAGIYDRYFTGKVRTGKECSICFPCYHIRDFENAKKVVDELLPENWSSKWSDKRGVLILTKNE